MKRHATTLVSAAVAFALMLGMIGMSVTHLTPLDAAGYHEGVRRAVDQVPYLVGDWIGQDVPVPTRSEELLKPNAILSRRYTHALTGQEVGVLFVHCFDARDLQGHYPPVCYPSQGWEMTDYQTLTLDADDAAIAGEIGVAETQLAWMRFRRRRGAEVQEFEVLNLMILPVGGTSSDMAGVDRMAGSHRVRHLGAAEIQLIWSGSHDAAVALDNWRRFGPVFTPVIRAIHAAARENPSP
jgi:Protein of unknown function (DUF3485)